MKTLRIIVIGLIFLGSTLCFSQLTPEDQKEYFEKSQKLASLLAQNPEKMDSIMKEMDKLDKQMRKKKRAQKAKAKKPDSQPANVQKATGHLKNFYLGEPSAKKFENWSIGAGDIVLVTQTYKRGNSEEIKIGKMSENGRFDFKDLSKVTTDQSISNYFKCLYGDAETKYNAPKTGIVGGHFFLIQNGKRIGRLKMASSRQQVFNNSPAAQYRGDPGYRIDLYYVDAATSAKSTCARSMEATDHAEIIKQIEVVDEYDLSFSPGWNYVKVTIDGSQNVGAIPYYKTKNYSVVKSPPADARWVFVKN